MRELINPLYTSNASYALCSCRLSRYGTLRTVSPEVSVSHLPSLPVGLDPDTGSD